MSGARIWLVVSCLLIALATALGAFGSHALQARVAPERLIVWRTAVDYHFFHALGLFGLGLLMQRWPKVSRLKWPAWLLLSGIVLFSGTLYATILGAPRWLNLVTPLGGLSFMVGWVVLAVLVWRQREE